MGRTMLTRCFSPEAHVLANTLCPRCVDRSLGGSAANWHHPPSLHVGHRKNLTTSEVSSMTHSTSVALHGSRGVSTVPLTNPSSEHRIIFLRASTETSTKPSRRWQPPKVASTTGLQLDHLVPLDAISQCNRTRITHSQLIRTLCKHK